VKISGITDLVFRFVCGLDRSRLILDKSILLVSLADRSLRWAGIDLSGVLRRSPVLFGNLADLSVGQVRYEKWLSTVQNPKSSFRRPLREGIKLLKDG